MHFVRASIEPTPRSIMKVHRIIARASVAHELHRVQRCPNTLIEKFGAIRSQQFESINYRVPPQTTTEKAYPWRAIGWSG